MENTLILVVTHRGISDETRESIGALKCPSLIVLKGLANLPRARSLAFDQALAATRGTRIDTILSVDDDMVFQPQAAHELVRKSRELGEPCSGFAVTQAGLFNQRPHGTRYLSGLAFMAIPRVQLEAKAETLPKLGGTRVWCQTGEHPALPGEWIGEDFWFCLHFGGVSLAKVAAGHLKWVPLWPTPESMEAALLAVLK